MFSTLLLAAVTVRLCTDIVRQILSSKHKLFLVLHIHANTRESRRPFVCCIMKKRLVQQPQMEMSQCSQLLKKISCLIGAARFYLKGFLLECFIRYAIFCFGDNPMNNITD
jgi:hypothetical protein